MSSIFDCCSSSKTVQNTDGTYSPFYDKKSMKTKKLNDLFSPKSSLRPQISLKSIRDIQTPVKIRKLETTQNINICPQYPIKVLEPVSAKLPFGSRSHCHKLQKYKGQITPKSAIGLKGQNIKQKILFSYNKKSQIEQKVHQTAKKQGDQQLNPSQIQKKTTENLQTAQSFIDATETDNKQCVSTIRNSKVDANNHYFNEVLLGGSKYTILSQGQYEENIPKKQQKLQESDIILNVFNASQSQVSKWGQRQSNQRNDCTYKK